MEQYSSAFIALFVILATLLIQQFVAVIAHRKQKHYIPGIVNASLSHDSFVFRSHRTLQNSLENLPLLLGTVMLAVFIELDSATLSYSLWIFAIARLIHMALYYAIATERNPSPRSYFYMIALLANLWLLLSCAIQLLS